MIVTLRQGVLDPAGEAVCSGLRQLGFGEARSVRLGKVVDIELDDMPREQALERLTAMGEKLLANPVIEEFTVDLV